MAGRIQLVRSVVQSMMMYIISIYSWPVSLIKDLEKWIRNFIWSGDMEKRKIVTVAWKKVCRPLSQGGLNLRSSKTLNAYTNLHLLWKLLHSQDDWAILLRDRVLRSRKPINHHIYSSLWSSIKEEFSNLEENSTWLLGNGEMINFWNDSWCGAPLSQALNIPEAISSHLSSTVSDYIVNGEWSIPSELTQMFPSLRHLVPQAIIPFVPKEDELIWKHSANGLLDLKHAYVFKRNNIEEMKWTKLIWNKDIPPSKSLMIWRLMQEKIPTDERLMEIGCQFASMCSLCFKKSESSLHLFFACSYAQKLWSWISATLNINMQFGTMEDIWKYCERPWSPQCKIVITAALVNLINTIWFARNESRFNDKVLH